MRWVTCCAVVCLFACGPSGSDADGNGGDDGSTSDDASAGEADSSDSGVDGGGGVPLRHGIVRLEFARGVAESSNPFIATTQVIATVNYRDCLIAFYANNLGMRQDGVDGARVFGPLSAGGEGWTDRLCDESFEHADCDVVSIVQELDVGTPKLTVTYAITGDLEGYQLLVGPLPTPEAAGCEEGTLAEVGLGDARGTDANGDSAWLTETFDPTQAVVNQGGAIRVYARSAG
jgi:hypothetical protein